MNQNKMKKYSAVDVNNNDKNNNKWKSYLKQITHNTTNNLYSTRNNFILTQHHRATKMHRLINHQDKLCLLFRLKLTPLILVITGFVLILDG